MSVNFNFVPYVFLKLAEITRWGRLPQLLEFVGRNCGVKLEEFVDVVKVYPGHKPAFKVHPDGTREIRIPLALNDSSKFVQFMFAAHEINHARMFAKLEQRLGRDIAYRRWIEETNARNLYAREEVLVQRAAEFQMRAMYGDVHSADNFIDYADALQISRNMIDFFKGQM